MKYKQSIFSLCVVGTLILASTVVSAMQGAKNTEMIDQLKEKSEKFNKDIDGIELFKKVLENVKSIQKNNEDFRSNKINQHHSSSDDFDDYWFFYKEAIKVWNSTFLEWQADNFEDWWDNAYQYIYGEGTEQGNIMNFLSRSRLAKNNIMIFGITMLVSSTFIPSNPNAFVTIFWLTLAVLFGYNFLVLSLYYRGVARFVLQLEWRQIDILVHVIDENGNGVEGLQSYYNEYGILEGYIHAHNIDAYRELDSDPIVGKDQFTYYLGPTADMDEPGWYSLSTWNHEDIINPYLRAPLAPGCWNITIESFPDGYQEYKPVSVVTPSIGTHERFMLTIQLEKQ
jgi:hypothetical protein